MKWQIKFSVVSLRFLFILIVSLITFCITVTVTYVTSKQYKKEAVEQLIHHVTTVNQDLSLAVTDYIITENYSSLQDFVLSYLHRPHLNAISVITPAGIIIADSQSQRLGQVVDTVQSTSVNTVSTKIDSTTDTMLSLAPINLDGTTVGWCQLTVKTKYLRDSLAALQKKVIAWGALTWLMAVMAAIIIASFIIRPINNIMVMAKDVSSGNFSKKTNIEGPLETRQLAVAFNAMTDELEKRETLLKESENRFRSLVEDISDWVWEVDENGVYTYASPAVEFMLGYRPDEVVGKTPYNFMTRTEAERVGTMFNAHDPQSEFSHFININLHKDGRSIVLETAGRPIIDETGQFRGYRGVDRDITEREQAARERKQLEQQLYQARKMEAVGTLAGGIAHDFNNILAAILGYAEIIEMELPENCQSAKDIGQVITAGHRATELIKQILTFSRKTEQRKQPLRIDVIVKEALKMLRSSLPASIEIETRIEEDCGLVYADPTNIHQIIVNLCTNGSQAIGNEKGRLVVSMCRMELEAKQLIERPKLQPGSFIMLSVEDTGKGMNAKTMARMFEPYFTSRGLGDGTGLGLAVIHGIVEDCNGFVEVESSPGKGSILRVFFPALEKDVDESLENEKYPPLPVGEEKILVVDDEPDLTTIIKVFLTRLGYSVETAVNSLDALEKFRVSPDSIDLVITDQTMPDLTGIELAQAIFNIKPGQPIILCTGYTSALSADEAYAIGVKRFVMKPLGKRKLAKIVRQVLDET